MSQKAFAFSGLSAIALTGLLLAVEPSQAAPRPAIHGGGFHGVVSHGGGFHPGAFNHGGFVGGSFNHGGFVGGGFNHGGFSHRGFFGGGFYGGGFYGGGYYPGYSSGYYPSYNYYPSYSYDPTYNYSPSYDYSAYPYGLGYGDVAPSFPDRGMIPSQSSYAPPAGTSSPPPVATDTEAHLTVNLPADADLWFNGSKVDSTGPVRDFHTPSLSPGQYSYEIRARWAQNGQDVTQSQTVTVSPGARVKVDFPNTGTR